MRTILAGIVLFAIIFGNLWSAEPTPTVSEQSDISIVQTACRKADELTCKAIMQGDIKAAQAWSTVSIQLKAGMYIQPIADMMNKFSGQLANLDQYAAALVQIERCKPLDGHGTWYQTDALASFLSNDVEAFKQANARYTAWQLLVPYKYSGDQKAEDLAYYHKVKAWIDGGLAATQDSDLRKLMDEHATALEPLKPLLQPHPLQAAK
jgi:hypothetical protein